MSERSFQPGRIERVAVRGANWVGDAVMTIPALRELRRVLPGAHITLVTRAWARGVFEEADFLDDILTINHDRRGGLGSRVSLVRELRRRRIDLAVLFPNSFEPALIAAAARVPIRIGYARRARRALLTHPLPVPNWRGRRHEVFYYLNIIAALERCLTGAARNEDEDAPPRLGLSVSDARRTEARALLRASGAVSARPLITLCPGSTNSRAKRWPAERFAALADQLIDDAGADVALIGAREELAVSQEVVRRMRRRPLLLTGATSLAQTIGVLSVSDLLITNDTGPAHLAAALNLPTLVIFGPTDPVTTRPFSQTAEVVRRPPECAPCMLRECPIDHRCMTAITPADLYARAARIVGNNCRRHDDGSESSAAAAAPSSSNVEVGR